MENLDENPTTFIKRVKEALLPAGIPESPQGRMKLVMNNLILHLHPTKVVKRNLKLTYTWGLGGLSALLLVMLAVTGMLLTSKYTPDPAKAYFDIINLQTNIWFGDLLRNVHHWSANLLIISVVLHMLRVFYTGAFRPPRASNWLFGLALLVLVLLGNFTGYLLPWDQLAYWAVTVATSVIAYVPLIGETLSRILLGGPEVGAATLLNFYSLHIGIVPVMVLVLMAYHFWRIRKDGDLSVSRKPGETLNPKEEKVTTLPNLVMREFAFALVWIAIILVWSMLVPAPLEGIADPSVSPNPAKAAWYFLGLQELLLHFHPIIAAVVIPMLVGGILVFLPFIDFSPKNVGVYFRSRKGRGMMVLMIFLGLILTPTWILLDEYFFEWSTWLPEMSKLVTTGLIPLAVVILSLLVLDEGLHQIFDTNFEERVMMIFTLLFTALVVMTLFGVFFRGPGMALYLPWNMPLVVH